MSITHLAQSNLSQLGNINVYCQDYIFATVPLFKTLAHILIFLMIIFWKLSSENSPCNHWSHFLKIKFCVYMYYCPLKNPSINPAGLKNHNFWYIIFSSSSFYCLSSKWVIEFLSWDLTWIPSIQKVKPLTCLLLTIKYLIQICPFYLSKIANYEHFIW